MTELDTPWCPCQEELFEALYPDLPDRDMPYVNEVDFLVEVRSHHYYEQKREENRDPHSLSRSPTPPKTPRTRRGEKIIHENFPDADLVCPLCEKEYIIEKTIRPATVQPEEVKLEKARSKILELRAKIEDLENENAKLRFVLRTHGIEAEVEE